MIQKLNKTDRISLVLKALRNGGTIRGCAKRFGLSQDAVRKAANRNGVVYSKASVKPEYRTAADGMEGDKAAIVAAFARLCDSADESRDNTPSREAIAMAAVTIGQDASELWDDRWSGIYAAIKEYHGGLSKSCDEWFLRRLPANDRRLSHFALAMIERGMNEEDPEHAEVTQELYAVAKQYQREPTEEVAPEPEPVRQYLPQRRPFGGIFWGEV